MGAGRTRCSSCGEVAKRYVGQTRADVTGDGLARFVSKPPAALLEMALKLEAQRLEAEYKPELRDAFRRDLSVAWPAIRELVWRSMGRWLERKTCRPFSSSRG